MPYLTSDPAPASWTVGPPEPADFPRWRALYQGYADFYGTDMPDERAERVWSWIQDPGHEVNCLVVRDAHGNPVGLAHYRPFARPLTGTTGGFLDDLFVDPSLRGHGAADALLARLGELAAERGWSVVRWITRDDNYRARAKYDQVSQRTAWVTYDMAPAAVSPDMTFL
ncbi:GNAT family N-acetyltransferase [Streptomyces sp. NPDC001339]|uniref:GNAT family N-acetyltransferase n=1 Tax=Streptomyces sp. NPDC001339 TaxID=3364563 RepID=UPI0036A34E03